MKSKIYIILSLFFIFQTSVFAEKIHLKNGDKLSGEIIEQTDENISLETDAMGTISIKRDSIDYVGSVKKETLAQAEAGVEEKLWQREVSLGYNESSGNTQNSQFSLNFSANRKVDQVNEFTLKDSVNYYSQIE